MISEYFRKEVGSEQNFEDWVLIWIDCAKNTEVVGNGTSMTKDQLRRGKVEDTYAREKEMLTRTTFIHYSFHT